MGRKRDLIREISDTRARAATGSERFDEVWIRLNDVLAAIELLLVFPKEKQDSGYAELIRYIPIALTACLEGYFKRSVKDLVDSKDKYRQNIRVLKNIKFDLDSVLAIEGRTVTIGEFVSHLISVASLEDIDGHMTAILGESFLKTVKTTQFVVFQDDEKKRLPKSVFETLTQMFEMRHVYCHEISREPIIDIQLAYLQVTDCVSFLYAAETVICPRAGPDSRALANALRG